MSFPSSFPVNPAWPDDAGWIVAGDFVIAAIAVAAIAIAIARSRP